MRAINKNKTAFKEDYMSLEEYWILLFVFKMNEGTTRRSSFDLDIMNKYIESKKS